MKRVAVLAAASMALALAACAVEKPSETGVPRAELNAIVASAEAEHTPAGSMAEAVGESDPIAVADTADVEMVVESERAITGGPSLPPGNGARDDSVRDAKEATEEAARKIIDATLDAANRIKEVGLGAVQSVRDSSKPADADAESGDLAANKERTE